MAVSVSKHKNTIHLTKVFSATFAAPAVAQRRTCLTEANEGLIQCNELLLLRQELSQGSPAEHATRELIGHLREVGAAQPDHLNVLADYAGERSG